MKLELQQSRIKSIKITAEDFSLTNNKKHPFSGKRSLEFLQQSKCGQEAEGSDIRFNYVQLSVNILLHGNNLLIFRFNFSCLSVFSGW